MPIHFLELASVSPNGTVHTHTPAHTHKLGARHPTVKAAQSHPYTQTDTCACARSLSARWDDSEEMASSSWGGPFAPLQKL